MLLIAGPLLLCRFLVILMLLNRKVIEHLQILSDVDNINPGRGTTRRSRFVAFASYGLHHTLGLSNRAVKFRYAATLRLPVGYPSLCFFVYSDNGQQAKAFSMEEATASALLHKEFRTFGAGPSRKAAVVNK